MSKQKKRHKSQSGALPWWGSALLAVLLAGVVTLLALWCQPNALRQIAGIFVKQPLLIILNALPVGLVLLAAAFLFGNVFYGAALSALLFGLFSCANTVKIAVRDEPVFPRDLALLKEVGAVVGSFHVEIPYTLIAAVLVAAAALIVLGWLLPPAPGPLRALQGLPGRALGALVSLGVLAALTLTLFASNTLYNSFTIANPYYVPGAFNQLGFPYCFFHHFTTYAVERPAGFRADEAEIWQSGGTDGSDAPGVNVVIVMNEAFSDISDAPQFDWTAETDPLKNLHALRAEPNALLLHTAVPGFAGGTANSEFDVLTGIQTNALSETTSSAFRVVNRDLDSLFRVYGAAGYATQFFHPGDPWFYNRENVYRWFGAEDIRFLPDFPDAQYKGRWVTDQYLAGQIIGALDDAVAEATPLFHYTTTIQNHMSYTADKYGADYVFPPLSLSDGVTCSEASETMLKVYFEGVRDADALLGALADDFRERSVPVVLVYFGDHLPHLGEDRLAYRELGLEPGLPEAEQSDPFAAYETPCLIWANDAAAAVLSWDAAVAALELPEDGTISAAFLGALVLELTGRGDQDPWFSYLNELRRSVPVVQGELYGPHSVSEAELDALITKWRRWSYWKLKYEKP